MNEQFDVNDNQDAPAEKDQHSGLIPMFHFKRMGRELAMQFLFQCDLAGMNDLAVCMENFWSQAEHSGKFPSGRVFRKARTYAEKLIAGVCEHEDEINDIIVKFSDRWDISRMSAVDRNIIRVAVFELFHCPDIPALVSINEAIEIAKDFSSVQAGNFINGILNAIKDSLPPDAKIPVRRASRKGTQV